MRGERIEEGNDKEAGGKHVSFNNMKHVSDGDTDCKRFYTDDELAQTAKWMKENGIDCDLTQLRREEQTELLSLLTEYEDVFAQNPGDIGLCSLSGCEHKIEIQPGAKPVRIPPHRATT